MICCYLEQIVCAKQGVQEEHHNIHACSRDLCVNDQVMAKNFGLNPLGCPVSSSSNKDPCYSLYTWEMIEYGSVMRTTFMLEEMDHAQCHSHPNWRTDVNWAVKHPALMKGMFHLANSPESPYPPCQQPNRLMYI